RTPLAAARGGETRDRKRDHRPRFHTSRGESHPPRREATRRELPPAKDSRMIAPHAATRLDLDGTAEAPPSRRVVITGIGCVTPIGTGVDGLWDGLKRRESAVRRIDRFDPTPFRSQIAAQVDDFDPLDHMDRSRVRRMDRFAQLAVATSRMALDDAGI